VTTVNPRSGVDTLRGHVCKDGVCHQFFLSRHAPLSSAGTSKTAESCVPEADGARLQIGDQGRRLGLPHALL
jgi:hypothetical protein